MEFITAVAYEERVWMKVQGERGRLALYIRCVYMPTDSTSVAVLDTCYERLKEVSGKRERYYCLVISMPGLVKRQMMMMSSVSLGKTRVMLVVISSSPFCVKWNWLHVMADS